MGTGSDSPHQRGPSADSKAYFTAQRTVLDFTRAGVSIMAFGFIVSRFAMFLHEIAVAQGVPEKHHAPISLWVGIAFLLVGAAVNVLGAVRYMRFVRAYRRGEPYPNVVTGTWEILLAATLAVIGLVLAGYLIKAG